VQVKPAEARLTGERPVARRERNGEAEDVDLVASNDRVGVPERGGAPQVLGARDRGEPSGTCGRKEPA
jgi:hypothetical protein